MKSASNQYLVDYAKSSKKGGGPKNRKKQPFFAVVTVVRGGTGNAQENR